MYVELKIKTVNTAIFFMIVSLLIFPLGGRSEIVFRLKLRAPKSVFPKNLKFIRTYAQDGY